MMVRERPLVSAIIIFLNAARFLEEAIQSVLGQEYAHWELLLVDDGSTDGSSVLALDYARRYPGKIRYLEHEGHQNRGMSASRNLGIRDARGAYVGFLDADDIWLPHKLAEQVALLESLPQAAMVYGRTLIWYSWTGEPELSSRDFFFDLGVEPNTLLAPPHLLVLLLQNKVQTPTTCNALLRREVFSQVGMFEERFRGMYEDQVFFAKVELASYVYVAGECWARYRQHAGNWSAQNKSERSYYAARLRFLLWFEQYLSEQETQPPEVWRALRRELRTARHPRLRRLVARAQRAPQKVRSRLGAIGQRWLRAWRAT